MGRGSCHRRELQWGLTKTFPSSITELVAPLANVWAMWIYRYNPASVNNDVCTKVFKTFLPGALDHFH